jgi:hypothetical protein
MECEWGVCKVPADLISGADGNSDSAEKCSRSPFMLFAITWDCVVLCCAVLCRSSRWPRRGCFRQKSTHLYVVYLYVCRMLAHTNCHDDSTMSQTGGTTGRIPSKRGTVHNARYPVWGRYLGMPVVYQAKTRIPGLYLV